ncbi:MAG: hypothetical protein IJ860_08140 [Eubacterium sp.]|nr:hypothetical protein [Eubacterium sp.]
MEMAFKKLKQASLTVEAACIVPFFFLCMTALICTLDIYGQYAQKMVKLQESAERTAAAESAGISWLSRKEETTGSSPENSIVDIPEYLSYTPFGLPFAHAPVRVLCRGRVHAWTGYEGSHTEAENTEDHLVYVTDYESVYHTTSECTHLDLTWEAVSAAGITLKHNQSGKKYHACEKCIGSGGTNEIVYISPQGDSYHNSAACSGLTRHVHLVKESETGGLHKCSRCAAKEAS